MLPTPSANTKSADQARVGVEFIVESNILLWMLGGKEVPMDTVIVDYEPSIQV